MPGQSIPTASILITDDEVAALEAGRRILYRPRSEHWDAQLVKFLDVDMQVRLDDSRPIRIVHLVREIAGKTMVDRSGRELPLRVKFGSRLVSEIYGCAVDPATSGECWAIILGDEVGFLP